jgi:hypothetical protein
MFAVTVIFYDEESCYMKLGAKEACGGSREGVFLVTGITKVRETFSG